MTKKKRLSKSQLGVIEDLFNGGLDEKTILEKHRVRRSVYNKWLADEKFAEEFGRRIDWLNRQSQALIARYSTLAAAKLVQLTESDKEETARKACLDIISLPRQSAKTQVTRPVEAGTDDRSQQAGELQLSPEVCSRLLTVLAEEESQGEMRK